MFAAAQPPFPRPGGWGTGEGWEGPRGRDITPDPGSEVAQTHPSGAELGGISSKTHIMVLLRSFSSTSHEAAWKARNG